MVPRIHGTFFSNSDNMLLQDAKWQVFEYLTLKLEGAPSGVNLADYDYRVKAPAGTVLLLSD